MLTEVSNYYAQLRREQAASNAIVFSLSFDDSSSFLASGTSVGHLVVHSIPINCLSESDKHVVCDSSFESGLHKHDTARTEFDLSSDGSVNALATNSHSLFVATDSALRTILWEHAQTACSSPKAVVEGSQINSLARLQKSDIVLAATARGSLLQVDPRSPTVDSIAESEAPSFPFCLSASPAGDHTILMVCTSTNDYTRLIFTKSLRWLCQTSTANC